MSGWLRQLGTPLIGPQGPFAIGTDGILRDPGLPDPADPQASQHPVEPLPPDTLVLYFPAAIAETDCQSDVAWSLFGHAAPGGARVQAICNHVHARVAFGYEHSRATRTAAGRHAEGRGVCRDFAHLAIAFCRCTHSAARYCTGYVSDIGQRPPFPGGPSTRATMTSVLAAC